MKIENAVIEVTTPIICQDGDEMVGCVVQAVYGSEVFNYEGA